MRIEKTKIVLWLCLLCFFNNVASLCAQSIVKKANITFVAGNRRITIASNGDILSIEKTGYSPNAYNDDVVVINDEDSFVDVNQSASIWANHNHPSVFYFPIGKYMLLREYSHNGAMLNALDELVRSRQILEALESIEIIGACSPTGSEEYNLTLALSRCMSLRSYLRWKHLHFAESFPIKFSVIGVDRYGYDVLKKQRPPLTEKQIWDKLQYAAIRLKMKDGSYIIPGVEKPTEFYSAYNQEVVQPYEAVSTAQRDTVYMSYIQPEPASLRMALKTNLLYDAALLPNLSVEWHLGKQWSLALEGNWSWWTFGSPEPNQWHHRIQAAGVELRRWVNSPYPLQGHALGVYSMIGNYDVRFSPDDEHSTGYLSYLSWSAGVSYAYNFPLTRKLNLELGVAAGYVGGRYSTYNYCIPETQWEQQAIYNRKYIGLTRVGVSLVWQLGADNYMIYKNK